MLDRLGNLPERDISVPFHRQLESIATYLGDLDETDENIEIILNALAEANAAEDRFDNLKKQLAPRCADPYEAVKSSCREDSSFRIWDFGLPDL